METLYQNPHPFATAICLMSNYDPYTATFSAQPNVDPIRGPTPIRCSDLYNPGNLPLKDSS